LLRSPTPGSPLGTRPLGQTHQSTATPPPSPNAGSRGPSPSRSLS
jgi:hypothetical protein